MTTVFIYASTRQSGPRGERVDLNNVEQCGVVFCGEGSDDNLNRLLFPFDMFRGFESVLSVSMPGNVASLKLQG